MTFAPLDKFAPRHIGPRGDDVAAMLKEVGAASLDKLIDDVIPSSIRLKAPGTELEIDIRGRKAKAVVVPLPFYKRPKK